MYYHFMHTRRHDDWQDDIPTIIDTRSVNNTNMPTALTVQRLRPAWLEARRRNRDHCRLYQLPEEMSAMILESANYSTRLVLRQTCSLFARLFSSRQPRASTDSVGPHSRFYSRLAMPIYKLPRNPRIVDAFLECIRRDHVGYCEECRKFRDADGGVAGLEETIGSFFGKPTRCAHCREKHPRILFSKKQRCNTLPGLRICLGAQGHVRLCEHTTAIRSWDHFNNHANAAALSAGSDLCHQCQHVGVPHHAPLLPLSEPPPYSNGPLFRVSRNSNLMRAWAIPIMRLRMDEVDEVGRQAHPATKDALTVGLVRNAEYMERMMCGHIAPTDPRLLLPFAPGQCACFDDAEGGLEDLPLHKATYHDHGAVHGEHLGHPRSDYDCCRCRSIWRPELCGQFLPDDVPAHLPTEADGARLHDAKVAWHARHRYACSYCPAVYSWAKGPDGTVYLQYVNETRSMWSATNLEWLKGLDPAWRAGVSGDQLQHVTWCRDRYCKTNLSWTDWLRPGRLPWPGYWYSPESPT